MQEQTPTVEELIIQIHDIARAIERVASLSLRNEAFALRKVADNLSHIHSRSKDRERIEFEERRKYGNSNRTERYKRDETGEAND